MRINTADLSARFVADDILMVDQGLANPSFEDYTLNRLIARHIIHVAMKHPN
jgi:hypothetical protein